MVRISLVPALVLMVFYVSTFRRMCAVANVAVFCSSRTSWLPSRSSYYWSHSCFHIPHSSISVIRSLYFKIFWASFLITLLSPEMATYISMHVLFSLSHIISGLLVGIVLSVRTCWFHNMVTFPPLSFYSFWHMFVLVFCTQLHTHFLTAVAVQLCTHCIMPFDVLFFCKYWAHRFMVCCLIKCLSVCLSLLSVFFP